MYIHEFRVRNQKKFISFTSSLSTIIGENSTGKTNLFYSLRHLFSEKSEKTTEIKNYNNSPDEVKKKEKIYSRSFSSSDWKVCGEKI